LLSRVPGLELVAHRDPETCCGSAGIYSLTQPELAGTIGRAKVDALLAAEPDLIATGNPGCMLQIEMWLRARGSDVPVVHPVELLRPRSKDS
jgi:glycolate oxidase iron-sulfur subunit